MESLYNLDWIHITWVDILDILVVAFVTYWILLLIKGTRAVHMLGGLAIVFIASVVSQILPMYTLHWILNIFLGSIIIIIVILFQEDLRRALTRMGRNPLFSGMSKKEESRLLEASLEDTLLGVLRRLDRAVAQDPPFLELERTHRLSTVRRELGDPAATPADKLRRVLEALLIETGYGGIMELHQERISVGGEELTCELLNVGRLALFWLTPDEKRGGVWNPATRAYEELDGGELESVRRAAQMASRRRAVGVQKLPLGRVGS